MSSNRTYASKYHSDCFNLTATAGVTPRLNHDRAVADIAVWFSVTTVISSAGATLLVLLLLTMWVNRIEHRVTSTRLLIIHLMALQLLLCGFTVPILNVQTLMAVLGADAETAISSNGSPRRINRTQNSSNDINNSTFDDFEVRGHSASSTNLPHSPIDCASLMFMHMTTAYTEAWAAMLLAVNRFAATAFPHSCFPRLTSRAALLTVILVPWCLGLGANLPVWFGVGGSQFGAAVLPYPMCVLRSKGVYTTMFRPIIGSYLPIGLMGLVYGMLLVWLLVTDRGRHRLVHVLTTSGPSGPLFGRAAVRAARQLTLTKILFWSFVLHAACFFPGVVIVQSFPQLLVRHFIATLWVFQTLIVSGHAFSPVCSWSLITKNRGSTL